MPFPRIVYEIRRDAGKWLVLQALVIGVGVLVHAAAPVAAFGACAVPLLVDVAAALLSPIERRLVTPFVTAAQSRLVHVAPDVVAITGSFGKTSTKQHVAHLLAGPRTVVASPAVVQQPGRSGPGRQRAPARGHRCLRGRDGHLREGEIAELCRWCPPAIAVITAIGPVHLERFKIRGRHRGRQVRDHRAARTVVLNVDDPHLAALADRLVAAGTNVGGALLGGRRRGRRRVSTADGGGCRPIVAVSGARRSDIGLPRSVQPTNLACALAVAFALGVPHEVALPARRAPTVANRLAPAAAPSGVWVIDDTFNSNPAGRRAALAELAGPGPRAAAASVVTPGMVELGPRQFGENRAFAEAAAAVATDLVIVGHTNRRALRAGWPAASAPSASAPGTRLSPGSAPP